MILLLLLVVIIALVMIKTNNTASGGSEESPRVHTLKFFDPPGYQLSKYIISGVKTVEGRKATPKYLKIKVGDEIVFKMARGKYIRCKVTAVKKYRNVKEYLKKESLIDTVPECKTIEEGVALYAQFRVKGNEPFLGIRIIPIAQNIYPLYHGSDKKLKTIKPYPSRLADAPVVFATPNKMVAASFIPKWSDDDFEHGQWVSDKYPTGQWYMREQYPGALKKLEVGGYIHKLRPKGFYRNDRLGLVNEYISEEAQKPVAVEYVKNVREYISGYFKLIPFIKKFEFY